MTAKAAQARRVNVPLTDNDFKGSYARFTQALEKMGIGKGNLASPVELDIVARRGVPGTLVKATVVRYGHRDLFSRILKVSRSNMSRVYSRKALDILQSETMLDTLRVLRKAEKVFGSKEKADLWMKTAIPALGGKEPESLMDTFSGRRMLSDNLRKIEYGEFS